MENKSFGTIELRKKKHMKEVKIIKLDDQPVDGNSLNWYRHESYLK